MIKRFNTTEHQVLLSVIDSIDSTILCSKYKQVANRIEVYPLEEGIFKVHKNKILAEKGFGSCLSKTYNGVDWYVSIIINMQKCVQANLTEREITAVVLHELGHILNEPEFIDEPTFEFCFVHGISFDKKVLKQVQESNSKSMEIYADSYVNKHGYGKELISTFHKQDNNFKQKIGYSSIRIEKIQKKEYFEGRIRTFNKNGR